MAVLICACDEGDVNEPVDRGYDYFPLRVGMYQAYNVTEITYSSLEEPDTSVYELLSEVVDSFPNTGGAITYVIHRYTRASPSLAWQFKDTWSARVEDEQAVVSEGNLPFVKLSFPLAEGLMWDGNRYNTLGEDQYELVGVDVTSAVNEQSFQNSAVVEQENYDDKVTRTDLRTEIYAKEVGLIKKESTILNYCTDPICLDEQIIESGMYYKQEITEYGIR